ncbi:uncharacterized protein LOC131605289 [Vicia villosa]|uniref:uncharacterized protein LOC131605289 n=1 Tax=Vicia villosa TaxID=3911 RepID=UPI00273CB2CD|nr:uncharacterized protein LOC131605289 [Vicia villosa]
MGGRDGVSWLWDFHVAASALLDCPEAMQEAFELLELLGGLGPVDGVEDVIKWWPNSDGTFSVKSCTPLFRERLLDVGVEPNNLSAINLFWRSGVPSKIKIFGWRLMLNRLPSKDQLSKRNIIHRDEDKVCVLCVSVLENLEHLFFFCDFSKKVWENILIWMEVKLVGNVAGAEHILQCTQAVYGKTRKKNLCIIWLATVWMLWNTRNNFIFNNTSLVLDDVIVSIKLVSWIWHSIGAKKGGVLSFYFWLKAPLEAHKNC